MLSVEEAKHILFSQIQLSAVIDTPVMQAYGNVLAEDILSPIDLPLFDSSSVDGFALATKGARDLSHFEVIGEIKAGDNTDFALQPGQAVRLFTGASVPASADTVVMQEKTKFEHNSLELTAPFTEGTFIRRQGSQIRKGEIALKKGVFLNPGAIGFIASLGIASVKVYSKPAISVIATGNEIIQPGNPLQGGEIYESNTYALVAALQQQHISTEHIGTIHDDKEALRAKIESFLQDSDILLLTGGISVGKYDFVYETLQEIGVETIFYKIAQRPGKPFYAGKIGNKLVFALPGNPASVMVCFYEYVYPSIRMMRGFADASLSVLKMKILKDVTNPEDRAVFIRAKQMEDGVMPLDKQDSGMMLSFAGGNTLIYIPNGRENVKAGEIVEVHLLPFAN